jgi:hypothetical protein
VHLQGVQVPRVHADEICTGRESEFGFGFRCYFDERLQSALLTPVEKLSEASRCEATNDQQHRVCSEGSGEVELDFVDHELLAE